MTHKVRDKDGKLQEVSTHHPVIVKVYNQYMGGVEKSDQYLGYHNMLRKMVRYWKMLFYHMIDVAEVNSFIIYMYTYNILAYESGCKTISVWYSFMHSLALMSHERHMICLVSS